MTLSFAIVTQRFGLSTRADPLEPDGKVDLDLHGLLPGLVHAAEKAVARGED